MAENHISCSKILYTNLEIYCNLYISTSLQHQIFHMHKFLTATSTAKISFHLEQESTRSRLNHNGLQFLRFTVLFRDNKAVASRLPFVDYVDLTCNTTRALTSSATVAYIKIGTTPSNQMSVPVSSLRKP